MAIKYATKNGNWSDTTLWNGGTLPGASDDVYANNYSVTIDQDITVLSLKTQAGAPAVQGGSFWVGTNRTITANLYAGNATVLSCNIPNLTITLNGNVYPGTTGDSARGIHIQPNATNCNLTINGTIYGCAFAYGNNRGILLEANNTTMSVNGNLIAQGLYGEPIYGSTLQSLNLTITGNLVGYSSCGVVYVTSVGGTLSVVGSINAGLTSANVSQAAITTNGTFSTISLSGGSFGYFPLNSGCNNTVITISPTNTTSSGPSYSVGGYDQTVIFNGDLAPTNANGLQIYGYRTNITVNGTVKGGSTASNIRGINIESQGAGGNITINGNCQAGTFSGATSNYAMHHRQSGCTITINGNIEAYGSSHGVNFDSGGSGRTILINGNITSAVNGYGLYVGGPMDAITHVGGINSGITSGVIFGVWAANSGNCSFSGGNHGYRPLNYGGATGAICTVTPANPTTCGPGYVFQGASCAFNITGRLTGGSIVHGLAISSATSSTVTVVGDVYGSATGANMAGITIDSSTGVILNVQGTVRGGSVAGGTQTAGITSNIAGGQINLVGDVYALVGVGMNLAASNTTLTMTGNAYGSLTAHAIQIGGNYSIVNITGGLNPGLTANGLNSGLITTSSLCGNVSVSGGIFGYNAVNYNGSGVCNLYPSNPESTTTMVQFSGSGVMNITSNLTGTYSHAATNSGLGTLNIIGNVRAPNLPGSPINNCGINHTGNGTTNVTGNVYGGSVVSGTVGALNSSALGIINITGDVFAGSAGAASYTSSGATNISTGKLNVYGTAYATNSVGSAYNTGVRNQGVGDCFVQVSKSNDYPNGGLGGWAYGTDQVSTSGAIMVDAMEDGSGGWPAGNGRHFIRDAGTNYCKMRNSNAGSVTVMGDVANDYPAVSNVRAGVAYSFGGLVGTCVIPPVSSVAAGVPVDNSVGTAALTPTALLGAALKTRLENCSTVQSNGDQLAALEL